MRPELQTSSRLFVSNPAPQRERGGAQQELLCYRKHKGALEIL